LKSTAFSKNIEYQLEINGESWQQGDIITGNLIAINHNIDSIRLDSSGVFLCYGKQKDIKANKKNAFEIFQHVLFPKETTLPKNSKDKINWEFKFDPNCPISDKQGSYYLCFGEENTANIKLDILLNEVFSNFITTFEHMHRFKTKEKKAKKNSVDIKLIPPNSREFVSLENVICNLSLDKDDILNITYKFKVKKINFQSIDLKAKSSTVQTKFHLEPKDYLIYKTSFNQEKVSQHISEALSEVKKSNNLF